MHAHARQRGQRPPRWLIHYTLHIHIDARYLDAAPPHGTDQTTSCLPGEWPLRGEMMGEDEP